MDKLNTKGFIAGGVCWLALVLLFITQMSCLDNGNNCGGSDFFLFLIGSIGLLAPAYIVAILFSPYQ